MRIVDGDPPGVCYEMREPILCTLETIPPAIIRHGHKVTREAQIRPNAYANAKKSYSFHSSSAAPKNNALVRMVCDNKRWVDEEKVLCLNVFMDARV